MSRSDPTRRHESPTTEIGTRIILQKPPVTSRGSRMPARAFDQRRSTRSFRAHQRGPHCTFPGSIAASLATETGRRSPSVDNPPLPSRTEETVIRLLLGILITLISGCGNINAQIRRDVAADADQTAGEVLRSSSKAASLCERHTFWWNKELQGEFSVQAVTIKGTDDIFNIYVSIYDYSASSTLGSLQTGYLFALSNEALLKDQQISCELAVKEGVRGNTFGCFGDKIKHITVCGPSTSKISNIKATITPLINTTNAIVYGKVTQSSTYGSETEAENVLDNVFGASDCLISCSLTQLEWNPWLLLKLSENYVINSVTVFNRNDIHGIRNFHIRVIISTTQEVNSGIGCGHYHFVPVGGHTTAVCPAKEKNSIKLIIVNREEYLGICGIDVDVDNSHVTQV